MEIIYWLIAVSVVLVGVIAWAFLWAVDSGQFDNLDGPATAILMDDERPDELRPPAADQRGAPGVPPPSPGG